MIKTYPECAYDCAVSHSDVPTPPPIKVNKKEHSMRALKFCLAPVVLSLGVLPATAGAGCLPVVGSVTLTPDPACTIAAHVPGPQYVGQCFSVKLSILGLPIGNGYAGVTSEPIIGADQAVTATPAFVPLDGQPAPRQIIQTARSAIALGTGSQRTMLYSADVTIIKPDLSSGQPVPEVVTEQIVITGTDGQGYWAGVTGNLVVAGNSIGQPAPVMGKICR